MATLSITVKNLEKTYPGKVPTRALRGVSFEIFEGEFVAIMGRSGSGKSTLLHQLGLLDTPTGGAITIGGTNILTLSETDKSRFRLASFGYIFQEFALIIELTALENASLPAMAKGGDMMFHTDHGAKLLSMVGLGDRLDHYPSELSGGEQQRVAIARALMNQPKVLFADEPTASLDTASSKTVLELFAKLNKELGQTIVMVTHEPEDRKYVDRVIWLEDGLITETET